MKYSLYKNLRVKATNQTADWWDCWSTSLHYSQYHFNETISLTFSTADQTEPTVQGGLKQVGMKAARAGSTLEKEIDKKVMLYKDKNIVQTTFLPQKHILTFSSWWWRCIVISLFHIQTLYLKITQQVLLLVSNASAMEMPKEEIQSQLAIFSRLHSRKTKGFYHNGMKNMKLKEVTNKLSLLCIHIRYNQVQSHWTHWMAKFFSLVKISGTVNHIWWSTVDSLTTSITAGGMVLKM